MNFNYPQNYSFQTINVNGIGFRDDGIDNGIDIIVIGDSFVMGAGVNLEDTFVEILEKKYGRDFLNMGIGGYSPIPQKRLLEKYGLELNPKVVIFSFYFNDFSEDSDFEKKSASLPHKIKSLLENFQTYNFIRYVLKIVGLVQTKSSVAETKEYDFGNASYKLYPSFWHQELKKPIETNITKSAILDAKKLTESVNATFILLIFPIREDVYLPDEILDSPRAVILDFCEKERITCVDLFPDLDANKGKQIYFYDDPHLTEIGHMITAESIMGVLK